MKKSVFAVAVNPRLVNGICLAGLLLVVGVKSWSRLRTAPSHLPTSAVMCDYSLNVQLAGVVCEQRQYPASFAYPLPGVLFWRSAGALGPLPGSLAWLVVLPASMIASLIIATVLSGGSRSHYGGVAMALAFAAVEYYLLWDLSHLNVNSFYMLLVLLGALACQRQRPLWAGIFFAASTAIKIYSFLLLPYLLFRREWRAASSMLVGLALFFVGVPLLGFGWNDTFSLTRQWLESVSSTAQSDFVLTYGAYKVSLSWIAMLLLNPQASGGKLNWLDWNSSSVGLLIKLLCLLWGVLVLLYFATTSRISLQAKDKRLAFMLDLSVILFCSFPASSFLQPHHLVVLLVPAVCLSHLLFDPDCPTRFRVVAGLTLMLGAWATERAHSPFRGIGVMLTLLSYLTGIWLLRRGLAPDSAVQTAPLPGQRLADRSLRSIERTVYVE